MHLCLQWNDLELGRWIVGWQMDLLISCSAFLVANSLHWLERQLPTARCLGLCIWVFYVGCQYLVPR